MDSQHIAPERPADAAAPAPDPLSPEAPEGVLSPRHRAMTIGMVALVSLSAFEALAVATAMPSVAQALDGLSLYALAFGGTLAASVVGMVVAGRSCDARGPAPSVRNGVAWFVAGLLAAGLAPNMAMLLAGRIMQGFGAGTISVALYVVVARAYPDGLRPRIFAAFSAAWVIPSLVGPGLSGLIVQHLGWRWVFLAVPLLALPAAWLLRPGLRGLRDTRARTTPDGGRLRWAVLAAAGACLLHLAGQRHDVVGVGLLALALPVLILSARRLLPPGSLSLRPGLPSVVALRGLASAAFFGTEVFIPLMLSHELGLTPAWAGVGLTVGALGWSLGSWYQGNTRRAWERTHLVRLGMGLMAAGIALVPLALVLPAGLVLALPGWTLTGVGMGLTYPSLSVLTLALSPPELQGRNSSALQLADALAIATMLAAGGTLVAALLARAPVLAFGASFAITGLLAAAGAVLAGRAGGGR